MDLPDIKTYYEASIIKIVWYQHKTRQIDQWNRTESFEVDSSTFGNLVVIKVASEIIRAQMNFQ